MSFGPWDMLLDFCWISLLLYAGKLIRAKLPPAQYFFLPSSIIAGLLGLLLSGSGLDVIPFSNEIQAYAWLLVVVLFASFPFSSPPMTSPRAVLRKAGSMLCFNLSAEIGLFAFSLLLGTLLLGFFFPDIRAEFPLLLPAGFVGGHGYAAAIGGTLETQYGFGGALTIGYTFATIGLFSAMLLGIPIIKWATRRGVTRFVSDISELPESSRTGLIPPNHRESLGEQTTCPSSLDPLAFHLALILIAAMAGYYLSKYTGQVTLEHFGRRLALPDMAAAMICGLLIKRLMNGLKLGQTYIDQRVVTRIGSAVTDYLVAFGVASIKIALVVDYIYPIALMCLVGYVLTLTYLFVFAPRMNPTFWFERGIFTFGWCTGVVAMGITLLRIVDPRFKSGTLEAFGLAYTVIAPIELFLVAVLPVAIGLGHLWTTTIVLLCLFLVLILLSVLFKFWSRSPHLDAPRPGEREVMASRDG